MRNTIISLALVAMLGGCASQSNETTAQYVNHKGEQWQVSTQSTHGSTQLLVNGELVASSHREEGRAYASGIYRGQMFSFHCPARAQAECQVFAGGQPLAQAASYTN